MSNMQFNIIHPLYDAPEEKRTGDNLGLMNLSWKQKLIMKVLLSHVFIMSGLVAYHVYTLSIHH